MKPITYLYFFNGHAITITRRFIGETTFPRNGNVHNPTQHFAWSATIDGALYFPASQRAIAYEYARAHLLGIPYRNVEGHRPLNVRDFRTVAAEMRANYHARRTAKEIKWFGGHWQVIVGTTDVFFSTLAEAEACAAKTDDEIDETLATFWSDR